LTGGGFVPHGADFTYCVVRERRAGAANYEDLIEAVAAALRKLGARDAAVWRLGPRGRDGYCFASLAPFDIHVGGRKIAGCAQRRMKNGVLHHGSIAAAAVPAVIRPLGLVTERDVVTLEELTGRKVAPAAFAAALAEVTGIAAA
jgi:lipoate-protein ligase A